MYTNLHQAADALFDLYIIHKLNKSATLEKKLFNFVIICK